MGMRNLLAALTALMLFATPVVAASDPPVQSAEVVFWQSISSSTDADDFVAYLERYPHGVFAPLARNKLQRMGVVVLAPEASPKQRPAVPPLKPDSIKSSLDGVYRASICKHEIKFELYNLKIDGYVEELAWMSRFSGKINRRGEFNITSFHHRDLTGTLNKAFVSWTGCHNQPFSFTKVE